VNARDRELGMRRRIPRRDFLNGMAIAVAGSVVDPRPLLALGLAEASPQSQIDYPPAKTGLRGSHEGSYEVFHALKDGLLAAAPGIDTGERYDLIVVGGGISGLAAAYFYRRAIGPEARILILDNHDDFGGHAKRNEFNHRGRLLIGYGGTQSIDSPSTYSPAARELLRELEVDLTRFERAFDRGLYRGLGLMPGFFFDRETHGVDRLVAGLFERPWAEFLAATPLSEPARDDVLRLVGGKVDVLPELTPPQKTHRLAKISYRDFLLDLFKVDPAVPSLFESELLGLYGVGAEAVPALDCFGLGFPGFGGMALPDQPPAGMSLTPLVRLHRKDPYIFHFPDGNASIARLLVRSLIPAVAAGRGMDDVVTARFDYGRLDDPGQPVRLRLRSTAVRALHVGAAGDRQVEVTYVRAGRSEYARGRACILACWNSVVPHLCPELPAQQKEALVYGVKVPLVYTNVLVRDWTAFQKLGVHDIASPSCYFSSVALDFPVSLGGYRHSRRPDQPILLHLVRTPRSPDLPAREQHRLGRYELLGTSFETFERNLRSQLGRILGPGGFDPARDLEAITVNRWPHGYAYEYNSLFDPSWSESEQPCVIGRRPLERIAIANSDAQAYAYTDAAIDQGHRAVQDVLAAIG
jgi:spermidine dehydrogenase